MQQPVCGKRNRGVGRGGGLYQFRTVDSWENLIPFHPSLSRCHSPPQVVITTQALTTPSCFCVERKKRKKEMSQTSIMNVFWKRQKWHIVCAQTSTDATLQIVVINRGNKSTLFILRHSWASCGLVCKALLIPIVIVIITFCYAAQGQCKQSREQFGFSNGEAIFTWHLQRNSSSSREMSCHVKLCADHNMIKSAKEIINRKSFYQIRHVSRSLVPTLEH